MPQKALTRRIAQGKEGETGRAGRAQLFTIGSLAGFGVTQVLEKLTVRLQEHDVATRIKSLTVSLQTPYKGIKLGVLIERFSIDTGCLGIAVTANNFRIAEGIGLNHRDFAIRSRTNAFCQLLTV